MIEEAVSARDGMRVFHRHEYLARHAQKTDHIFKIEEGWACQYRLLVDGRRQIITLFLPGEYCEPQWLFQGTPTLPVVALTRLRARSLSMAGIHRRPAQEADGMTSILESLLTILNRREQWIFNLGRLSATERLCSLLCELFERLKRACHVIENRCVMPLTQYDLADIVGLSAVHVNRVLQMLRAEKLIELHGKRLTLLNIEGLRRLAITPNAQRLAV